MPVKHHGCTNHGIPHIKEAEVLAVLNIIQPRFELYISYDNIVSKDGVKCSWNLGELLIDQDWETLDFLYNELLIDND